MKMVCMRQAPKWPMLAHLQSMSTGQSDTVPDTSSQTGCLAFPVSALLTEMLQLWDAYHVVEHAACICLGTGWQPSCMRGAARSCGRGRKLLPFVR